MDYGFLQLQNFVKAMDKIDYAELYGVYPDETDFSGAIKRTLNEGVQHISKEFIDVVINIRNYDTRK